MLNITCKRGWRETWGRGGRNRWIEGWREETKSYNARIAIDTKACIQRERQDEKVVWQLKQGNSDRDIAMDDCERWGRAFNVDVPGDGGNSSSLTCVLIDCQPARDKTSVDTSSSRILECTNLNAQLQCHFVKILISTDSVVGLV